MKHYAWFCCMALNLCVSIVIMLTSTWLKKYELMVQAMASMSCSFVLLQCNVHCHHLREVFIFQY